MVNRAGLLCPPALGCAKPDWDQLLQSPLVSSEQDREFNSELGDDDIDMDNEQ